MMTWLFRSIALLLLYYASFGYAEDQSVDCASLLSDGDNRLALRTSKKVIKIAKVEIGSLSVKAYRALKTTPESELVSCYVFKFEISDNGQPKSIQMIHSQGVDIFHRSARKAVENSSFSYDEEGCNTGIYTIGVTGFKEEENLSTIEEKGTQEKGVREKGVSRNIF